MEIGLSLDEFWSLTAKEFKLHGRAFVNREKVTDRRLAWMQANLLNAWSKRRIKISDILPDSTKDDRIFTSKENLVAELNKNKGKAD